MFVSNKYIHCGAIWTIDHSDSFHNDHCPNCDIEISPISSIIHNTDAYISHCDHYVFKITLAAHSISNEFLNDLEFLVVSGSVSDINQKLMIFSNLYDSFNITKINLDIDDANIDFTVWDSFDFIKECFIVAYENVANELVMVKPTEYSSFQNEFNGRINQLKFIDDRYYISVRDSYGGLFNCTLSNFYT